MTMQSKQSDVNKYNGSKSMGFDKSIHRDIGNIPVDRQEYLSFRLGSEHYAIDILSVQEIRGYEPVTRIANAPDFV